MAMQTEIVGLFEFAAEAQPVFESRKLRTLVVDDSASMLESVCSILEYQDLAEVVATSRNGVDAVQAAAGVNPELVLMDVSMPMMNGLEAAKLISEHFPDTRIVLMSGEDTPEVRRQSRASGADAFVPKVGLMQELPAVIGRLFPSPQPSPAGLVNPARQL